MQRYFVEHYERTKELDEITIFDQDIIHHMRNVMRMAIDDKCILMIEQEPYQVKVLQLDKESICCRIISRIHEQTELTVDVTMAFGLSKGDKPELIIQKCTELGANAFIPLNSERTIVKLNHKKEKKRIDRYVKVASESSEQSYRHRIPTIHNVQSLSNFSLTDYDLVIVAYEETVKSNQSYTHLSQLRQQIQSSTSVLCITGPEGGFTSSEIDQLQQHDHVMTVGLGRRILRAETAPIYMMSVLSYMLEANDC
ncbi:RsmE family RNA methyltransferase [Abyssicoccus albus]|uniref:Ribosomal RNA small subunit methyltransferase E n=1 Tax=Abyssicoccus albus TaxID=1817405 RepID=A0A3N5CDB5_9BACL|nr:RsmE family RNA methyltransferase [Abyssicoccus albus]RPF58142.1 16S rRNA (uracil1498-N3)-methyltransferase [Abyssicoccus albus]